MKTHLQTKNRANSHPSERGFTLIVVIILCLATLIVVGSYLRYATTQAKLNARATLAGEARAAAEGAAEYALGEMTRRSAAMPSFGVAGTPLSGYTLPTTDVAYLAPGTGNNHVVDTAVAYKAGAFLSNGVMTLIDSNDPINGTDTENGKTLNVRLMKIFGKAAVKDPLNQDLITSYVSETVQVREQAWFNYAVFFNMDMEFHSQTTMDIYGPVFTNANAYLAAGTSLNFYSNLTAAKKILRTAKYSAASTPTGDVFCIKANGMLAADLVEMQTTQDSNTTSTGGFRTLAHGRWKDYVQDQSYTVVAFNPPGLPAYVPEDFAAGGVQLRNNAYSMIEPQLSNSTADTDYGQKSLDRENLKFSALAGMVIEVLPPATIGAQPKWVLRIYKQTDTTHPLSADNPPDRSGVANGKPNVVTIDPFNDQDDGANHLPDGTTLPAANSPAANWIMKRALKIALLDAIVSVPYGDANTVAGTSWGNGFSNLKAFTTNPAPATAGTYYPAYDRREGYVYPGGATSNTNLLKGAMHVLRINLGKLNTIINTPALWLKPDGSAGRFNVATNYSGVVYVQFPLATIDNSRFPPTTADGDMIRPARGATTTTPGYALVLANAGTLPQVAGGTPDGFTIATNGPVYVHGHYNADGNSATGSETAPDSASEVPAMIAGDTVTILSPGFSFQTMATTEGTASAFTEVSAAIVTGLVPTQPGTNDIWAGGVHNFARFHENWAGVTYRYRGSLAALFECEVNKAPWRQTYYTYWYDPPTRDVGYHVYLAGGRFPPGTPVKRTVRRLNLQDITAATYNAGP